MMEVRNTFSYCNQLISDFEQTISTPKKNQTTIYYTGVDLGTSCIVLSVLDADHQPVAGAYRYASVVKDGMVVDYLGAIQIVRELKEQLEEQLDAELTYCAVAIPPGTEFLDGGVIRHVVEAAGFELTALLDEKTVRSWISAEEQRVSRSLKMEKSSVSMTKQQAEHILHWSYQVPTRFPLKRRINTNEMGLIIRSCYQY